jgi:glycosyltransferase involved in cell wall biosynthesis
LKILFISYSFWPSDFGGELLISLERFQSLAERGHKIIALTSGRLGFNKHYIDKNIEVYRSPINGDTRLSRLFRRIIYFFWIISQLFLLDYDVVHLGSMGAPEQISNALETWFVSCIIHLKKKRCIYVHSLADTDDNPFVFQGFMRILKKTSFTHITDIVSVSPALHRGVKKAFPDKGRLIVNGIRDDIYKILNPAEKEKGRKEFGVSSQDVIFTFLGSVGTRKGFDILAEAFTRLAANRPNWNLWVIGPCSHSESANVSDVEVREVSKPLDLVKEQVTWHGRIDDRKRLSKLLAYSDAFVFPSRREGMGIAPLEAMSVGLPVIISRIKGITDLANIEGETGLYVRPGDVHELEQSMLSLGENGELRNKMGMAGHEVIQEKFRWEPFIDQWEKLYQGEL